MTTVYVHTYTGKIFRRRFNSLGSALTYAYFEYRLKHFLEDVTFENIASHRGRRGATRGQGSGLRGRSPDDGKPTEPLKLSDVLRGGASATHFLKASPSDVKE